MVSTWFDAPSTASSEPGTLIDEVTEADAGDATGMRSTRPTSGSFASGTQWDVRMSVPSTSSGVLALSARQVHGLRVAGRRIGQIEDFLRYAFWLCVQENPS